MNELKPLRTQLRELLADDRLDDQQVAALRRLERSGRASGRSRWKRPWPTSRFATATLVALLIAAPFFTYLILRSPENRIPELVAEEVTTNHIYLHPLDFETADIQEIRDRFYRLEFLPISDLPTERGGYQLRGGRYCTLQGMLAIQLVYDSPQGEIVTYYQTAYDPEKFGSLPIVDQQKKPLVLTEDGVAIYLWVEENVVVAEARSVSS